MSKLFAIKDAMKVKITPLGASEPAMTVDYLNDCSFSKEGEVTYAKKNGANAIAFNSAPTGTLTMNSELTTLEMLGMSLGGVVTGEKISVTSVAPATAYKIEGEFRCTFEDGSVKMKNLIFYNAKPQPKCELAFSGENVASFALVFDLMVDPAGKFLDIDDPKEVA